MALGYDIDQVSDWFLIVTQSTETDNKDTAYLQAYSPNKEEVPDPPTDVNAFRRVLGKMLYIGRTTYPTCLHRAPVMTTMTSDHHAHNLKNLCSILPHASPTTPNLSCESFGGNRKFALKRYCDAALDKRLIDLYDGRLDSAIFFKYRIIAPPLHKDIQKRCRVARNFSTVEISAALNIRCLFMPS